MPRADVEKITVARTPDETYDDAAGALLPATAAAAGVFQLAVAGMDVGLLDAPSRLLLAGLSLGAALVLGGVALTAQLRPVDRGLAHPLASAVVLAVVGVAVTHMVVLQQPRQTVDVLVALAASGVVLMSLRWLVGTLYLAWGAWAAGAVLVGPAPSWPQLVLGMVAASGLAVATNHLRRGAARELAVAHDEAAASAVRDHLTGVANRRGLALVGGQIVETARRQGDASHCIFIDVDGLKRVNDLCGHATGDEVIVAVADALREVTRSTDVVARWGGDEFCIVGPGAGMSPLELERRVRDHVRSHSPVTEEFWSGRVSAGGAMLEPWDSGTLETLLGKADQEMYLRRSLRREGQTPAPRPASAE